MKLALRCATTMFAASLLLACAAGDRADAGPATPDAAPVLEAAVFDPTTLVPWTFVLVELPDAAAAVGNASTELRFEAKPEGGYVVTGHGPCNSFSSPAAFTGDPGTCQGAALEISKAFKVRNPDARVSMALLVPRVLKGEKCPECGYVGAEAKSTKTRGEYRRCIKCQNEWDVTPAEEPASVA